MGFYVDGFWAAFLGGLIVSIVGLILSAIMIDKYEKRRVTILREAFQRIVTDVLENDYSAAEAMAKHVGAGGSELVDFIMEGMKGKCMTPRQLEEFAKGYSQLFLLLQLGSIAGVTWSHCR